MDDPEEYYDNNDDEENGGVDDDNTNKGGGGSQRNKQQGKQGKRGKSTAYKDLYEEFERLPERYSSAKGVEYKTSWCYCKHCKAALITYESIYGPDHESDDKPICKKLNMVPRDCTNHLRLCDHYFNACKQEGREPIVEKSSSSTPAKRRHSSITRSPVRRSVSNKNPKSSTRSSAASGGARGSNAEKPKKTKKKSVKNKYDASALVYEAKSNAGLDRYRNEHLRSIDDAESFWAEKAVEYLDWEHPFEAVVNGTLEKGDVSWFLGGKLNACYNAIDKHVINGKGDKVAIIYEGDEPSNVKHITYSELMCQVSRIGNVLKSQGVQKGDVVTIYLPMVPELPMTMLACARIGAVHSVVYVGLPAEVIAKRIVAAESKVIVTATESYQGGKCIPLKDIVNEAREKENSDSIIEKVLVWERIQDDQDIPQEPNFELKEKDIRMDLLVRRQRPYCPVESMDSEDYLFIVYTSGTTGTPKGLVHTTGGYALYAAFTTKTTFDISENDIFACVADLGGITGHTYTVYGPLLNGIATLLFESTPLYPDPGRYWDMVQRHNVTQFYTTSTTIRSLIRFGDEIPIKYDLSSLKVIGSVGEPINPEAWRWYYECIGRDQCTVVDTYIQSETGGIIITNIPGITPMKPGSCTLPMYGIEAVILDPVTGNAIEYDQDNASSTEGVIAIRNPWPGIARTCIDNGGGHEQYMNTYMKPYKGYYYTGDTVVRDEDGYYFLTGHVDDVITVTGHTIGCTEIESSLMVHSTAVSQAIAVAKPDMLKGQAVICFITLQLDYQTLIEEDTGNKNNNTLIQDLKQQVRNDIGPYANPEHIYIIDTTLPCTHSSGKILRRILRKLVVGDTYTDDDTYAIANPNVMDTLIEIVEEHDSLTGRNKVRRV